MKQICMLTSGGKWCVSLGHTCTVDWSGGAAAYVSTGPGNINSAGLKLPSEVYSGCCALLKYPLLHQDTYTFRCREYCSLTTVS